MNRYGVGVAALLIGAVLSGCGSSTEPLVEHDIVGTWDWVESSGGVAGTTQTPETAGYTLQVKFAQSGVVEVRRDGALETSTGYMVLVGVGSSSEWPDMVRYDEPVLGFENQYVRFTGDDVMFLADGCCDGFVSRYVRGS